VPTPIITQAAKLISTPLSSIFNLSICNGHFPSNLKTSVIIPVHKKGSHSESNNYRPIALLSVFSKILEKLLYSRITNYLCHHNLLQPSQHGFIKGKSTMSAAFQLINEIIWGLSNQKEIIGIFFDLSKTFDTLNHDILFSKLSHMGINGNALAWIRSYLSDRKQLVQVNTNHKYGTNIHRSNVLVSNCGVSQESILGPLLFIIFINDLISHLCNSKVTLYADDTSTLSFGD
jgi:hypothetical protein